VLRAMGGVLEERSALEQMLHVAAEGDVSKLRMLVQSGIPIDKGPNTPNMAHIRQSRPVSGLGFQVKVF